MIRERSPAGKMPMASRRRSSALESSDATFEQFLFKERDRRQQEGLVLSFITL
jgi:hypothetical protein